MQATLGLNALGDKPSPEEVGGKAASLARLAALGFNVPGGFVIPASIAAQLEGEWPVRLHEEIVEAFRSLAVPVAVRSSATDEDGAAASFAGQHQTVLGVEDEEGLVAAVRTCLASLGSDAATSYRERAGRPERPARMAVVVQRMVPAEIAGVAFSIDPLTGDTNRVVVEAVRGLGEGLVAGTVEADRLVLDRVSLAVLESHHPGEPVLAEAVAREAARAALRAEDAFGAPQDIEFAWAEGALWMLQSRPVTTLTRAEAGAGWVSEFDTATSDDDFWTSANVQEILPGLLTPLTITIFTETTPESYTRDYQDLHLLARDENPPFIGVFYNRVFLNVAATRLVGDRALGGSADAVERRYLGGEPLAELRQRDPWKTWMRRFVSFPFLVNMLLTLERDARRAERATLARERRLQATDFASLSDAALVELRDRMMWFSARAARPHLRITANAGFGYDKVMKLVRPVLGDRTDELLPTLFTGLPGVESAQIGQDLWELSRIARREGLTPALARAGFDPLDADLPRPWCERFAAFLARHGHRGLNELEASSRTWRRDPRPVLDLIAAYAEAGEERSPAATFAHQQAERVKLETELFAKMQPWRRALTRWVLRDAQKWVAMRERTKSMVVRGGRLGDYFLPEIQRRLVERASIDAPGDVFFIANHEITAALRGQPLPLQREVARRRREYERNRHVVLPDRFRGHPSPVEPDLSHHAGDVLTGTPVSPGVVTGRARVIFDPAVDGPMQPGEILVAPVTDAGWTPLFALASGLVVDMGSALSHGSTVAREYGLPAVVNVRRATRSIRTGDLVTVNGSKGTVTIIVE